MAEVIDLKAKKKRDQDKKAALERARKMEAVLQMFQCSRCSVKCMKCGSQLQMSPPQESGPGLAYRFCESCKEEYLEFLERLHGRGDPTFYWYNREWMDVWKAWMHYQDALGRYQLSEEFRRLIDEIKGR
ncbi:MAG: hypothetical protein ACUVS3_04680 [Thermodesulfobacteriota bacterium]